MATKKHVIDNPADRFSADRHHNAARTIEHLGAAFFLAKLSWGEFWQGYLTALAWTATDEDGAGEALYPQAGGEFEHDTDELERQLKRFGELDDIRRDALRFYVSAVDIIPRDRMETAGHDFHLTRNGHGAGFWDGDWPRHGSLLTELSQLHGGCELYSADGELYVSRG